MYCGCRDSSDCSCHALTMLMNGKPSIKEEEEAVAEEAKAGHLFVVEGPRAGCPNNPVVLSDSMTRSKQALLAWREPDQTQTGSTRRTREATKPAPKPDSTRRQTQRQSTLEEHGTGLPSGIDEARKERGKPQRGTQHKQKPGKRSSTVPEWQQIKQSLKALLEWAEEMDSRLLRKKRVRPSRQGWTSPSFDYTEDDEIEDSDDGDFKGDGGYQDEAKRS